MAQHRNATPDFVRRHIAEVRRNGYCISRAVLIEGATGISAAVPYPDGRPYLAVSISAVSTRVPKDRVKPLASDLVRTCARMAHLLKSG
jgi:DNA-binding IclR family transcriptional regulator